MTMQIAIEANDGFILASDLKHGLKPTESLGVRAVLYHSKISINERHGIAIAMQGMTLEPNANPVEKLDEYLTRESNCPNTETVLRWLSLYAGQNPYDHFSLLLVSPKFEFYKLWRIDVENGEVQPSRRLQRYVVQGNEQNAAIMWLQYFNPDESWSLHEAANLAALALLTAHDVNQPGVEGLEAWRYTQASSWQTYNPNELKTWTLEYAKLKKTLQAFISGSK